MYTFDMLINNLKFIAVVIGIITAGAFIYARYLNWKENRLKKEVK